MAKMKTEVPQYGTIMQKGIQYYRTRIMDADGKQVSLYAATCEELYEKQLEARRQVEEIIFRRQHPTVAEYCQKWLLMQSAKVSASTLRGYKMKLDAMKRQGQRTDLTSDPVGWKLNGKESAGIVGKEGGDSQTQVRRYIRLTHLIPDILELVDNSVLREPEVLQIAMRPAVELSYLRKEEQADLFAIMEEMDCTPSHAQAIKMRQMSEAKTGDERLAKDALVAIMKEEKPNQKEQIKIPKERISKYFAPGTPAQKIEDTIVQALELYRRRQRSLER